MAKRLSRRDLDAFVLLMWVAGCGEARVGSGGSDGVDLGRDLGVDLGRDLGVDLGRDLGIDLGRDLGVDLGRDLGRDLGVDLGRDLGQRDASAPDSAVSLCGDGLTEANELCDDGESAGVPGGCALNCMEHAPRAAAFPSYQISFMDDAIGGWRTTAHGQSVCEPSPSPECVGMCIEDRDHCAKVRYLGGGEWQLDLHIKPGVFRVPALQFPSQSEPAPLGDSDDDVYYYPFLSGVAERYDHRADPNNSFGLTYPGGTFAPLALLADPDDARLIFASNWPPVAVSPVYGGGRLTLWYQDAVSTDTGGGTGKAFLNGWLPGLQSTPLPGETRTYRFVEVRVSPPDVPAGTLAWHVAIDHYKRWLVAHRGPLPPVPEWQQASHGFIGVQLESMVTWDPTYLFDLVADWGADMPSILIWGQMSDYRGDCCTPTTDLHPRYDMLEETIAGLRALGQRVGLYIAPNWQEIPNPGWRLHEEVSAAFLTDWLDANIAYGADVHYIDTLARVPWASPALIRNLFHATADCAELAAYGPEVRAACGRLPPGTVIEGAVDIYPAAGLMDGSLTGFDQTGLQVMEATPYELMNDTQPLSRVRPFVTFPRLGFYLMDEHVLHLGGYNNDYRLAGTSDTNFDDVVNELDDSTDWYWSERDAFLLGARITGAKLEVWLPGRGLVRNPMLGEIIAERDRFGFFARRTRYRDVIGIGGLGALPAGVDVRRFTDAAGGTLLAVVNWTETADLSVTVDGQVVPLCARRFTLVDVAAPACP